MNPNIQYENIRQLVRDVITQENNTCLEYGIKVVCDAPEYLTEKITEKLCGEGYSKPRTSWWTYRLVDGEVICAKCGGKCPIKTTNPSFGPSCGAKME